MRGADLDVHGKLCLGNWLAVTGGDPGTLKGQLPDVLQHLASQWSPYSQLEGISDINLQE